MAETDEPGRPKPSAPGICRGSGRTLPRPNSRSRNPWSSPGRKARTRRRAGRATSSPGRKRRRRSTRNLSEAAGTTKLEETPVLDTYEARQRARWIIGGILGRRGVDRSGPDAQGVPRRRGRASPGDRRAQARQRRPFQRRVRGEEPPRDGPAVDKVGNTRVAVNFLEKVAKNYPATAAAREAMHATDRHRRKLPLFGVDVPEQAPGPKPPPEKVAAAPAPGGPPVPASPPSPRSTEAPAPQVIVAQAAPAVPIKPLPSWFREKPGTPIHASGWPMQIVSVHDGGVMVLVPGGSFLMGREDGEPPEGPPHRVSVSTYYIDQHEVTVRQFVQFLKETGRPWMRPSSCPGRRRTRPHTRIFPPST